MTNEVLAGIKNTRRDAIAEFLDSEHTAGDLAHLCLTFFLYLMDLRERDLITLEEAKEQSDLFQDMLTKLLKA